MRRLFCQIAVVAPMLGCKPELPSLDYRGERVRVGSDVVDQICGGTLNRLDREVEQFEARLDLPTQESLLDVYVVDRYTVEAYCPPRAGNCTIIPWRGRPYVMMDQRYFEWSTPHELVHARLAGISTVPLFTEGIAEAVSPPSCPQPVPDIELSEVLAPADSDGLAGLRGSYYVAGELVAWLLDEFGPGEVLSLMRSIDKGSSSSTAQAKYFERFDRALESDFLAHVRTQADLATLPPEDFGCLTPPVDSSKGQIQLIADLDCDSELAHNNFGIEGSGYVDWTLELDHEQTLELVGVVPSGTVLSIEKCGCVPSKDEDDYLLPRSLDPYETLQPGSYRLRWVGALDEGLALDVELVALEG